MLRRFQISPASQGWEGLTACSALLPFTRQAPMGHGREATQPGETLTVKIKTRIRAEGKRKQPVFALLAAGTASDRTALASPGLRPRCPGAALLAPHPDLLDPAGCGPPRRSARVPVHAKAASPGGAGTVRTPRDPSGLHPASHEHSCVPLARAEACQRREDPPRHLQMYLMNLVFTVMPGGSDPGSGQAGHSLPLGLNPPQASFVFCAET